MHIKVNFYTNVSILFKKIFSFYSTCMALKALRFAAFCELAKTGTVFGGLETVAQKVK